MLDNLYIVRRNVAAEPRSDTLSTIHENHREHRRVKLGLDLLTIIHYIFQNRRV
jgi:hypothetical protein